MFRQVLLGIVVAGAAAAMLLSGCSAAGGADGPCVPQLAVSPDDPHPGRIVTVITTHACPVRVLDRESLTIRIHPEGARIPLAQAKAAPAEDGSFAVSITVPPTMPKGPAVVEVSNWWDYAFCPDDAGCPAPQAQFEVGESLN